MQKRTRSLLEELETIGNNRDINHIIESRAHNLITSAINLIDLMGKHYGKEKAELLEKKLLTSIRVKEPQKFANSLKK